MIDPAVLVALGNVQRRLQQLSQVDDGTIVRTVRNWIGTAESGSLFMAAGDEGAMIVVGLGLLALWLSLDSTADPGVQGPPVPGPVSGGGGTPSQPGPPVPPVVGPPVSSGSGDQIDPGSIQVVNTFDFRGYPITAKIVRVVASPDNVQIFTDGVEGVWPHVWPDGIADNGINFTVGLVLNIGGQWVGSGFIQGVDGYKGSEGVGDGIADFARNWYYSDRWSPMTGHAIQPGETIGLFLMAGNGRDGGGPEVAMRTQIVAIQATSDGVFTF